MSILYIGRHVSGPEADYAFVNSGQMRACVFDTLTQSVWVHTAGVVAGRSGAGSPTGRIAIYGNGYFDNVLNPRLGHFLSFTASTAYVDSTGGALYERALEVSAADPLTKGVLVRSGSGVFGAILMTGQPGTVSMRQAAAISAADTTFYDRSGLSQPPPAPFGSYAASNQGHLSIYFIADANVAPNAPANMLPAGSTPDLIPTFSADFRDLNGAYGASSGLGADRGDAMGQYQIQCRRVSDAVSFWMPSTFPPSAAEIAANAFTRPYGGTTLVRGTPYEWRARVADRNLTWGPYSAWTAFTPTSAGTVTLDGTPSGKQETVQPGPFQFRWTHATALSTNAVEIRLRDAGGNVVRTSPTIAKTTVSAAAPGTLDSVTWAQTAFANLNWGDADTYEVRGRDTANAWSAWSAGRAFTVNAAPPVPTNLSPSGSAVRTAPPILTALMNDPDDTPATGELVKFEILSNAGAVLFTRTAALRAGTTDTWDYQTTSTDLASFATYRHRAYGYDGTVYSGGQTVEANAVRSADATFVYAQGPIVAVTSPADNSTITTATPTVAATITGVAAAPAQQRWWIAPDGSDLTGAPPIWDSGWEAWTGTMTAPFTTSRVYPAGYMKNGVNYDLYALAKSTGGLDGYSTTIDVLLSYTAPAALTGVSAAPFSVGSDPWPTAVRVAWGQTAEPTLGWLDYTVYRSDLPNPLATVTSQTTTEFVDPLPVSGQEYVYTVTQHVDREGTTVESPAVSAAAAVNLGGVVLCGVTSPLTVRAVLASVQSRSHESNGAETRYQRWGDLEPTTVREPQRWWNMPGTYLILGDARATARQRRDDLEALWKAGGTFCQRDERGLKRFVVIPVDGLKISDLKFGRCTVDLVTRQESYREGVPS